MSFYFFRLQSNALPSSQISIFGHTVCIFLNLPPKVNILNGQLLLNILSRMLFFFTRAFHRIKQPLIFLLKQFKNIIIMHNTKTPKEIAENIKTETWNNFRQKYRQKFKKQYDQHIFTVLASISLVDTDGNHQVVSCGFGTKSLPQSVLLQHNPSHLLADMHAQSLAIQGFKRFLLKQLKKQQSLYLQWVQKKKKHQLSKKFKIYFYCSEVFCGDCCINEQQQFFSGAKPLKYFSAEKYPELKYEPNILRTKPGRLDLPIHKRSPFLCCSDLLALYNLTGVQGPQLFSKVIPLYIDTFVIQCSSSLSNNLQKGIDFVKRLSLLLHRPQHLIERQIFNILIQGKQRKISSQFQRNKPNLILLTPNQNQAHSRNQQGFDLCGVLTNNECEWINGKSGLPEGNSLKNYLTKGKISLFSQAKLASDFPIFKQGQDQFKYKAIKYRLNILFGEWIDNLSKGTISCL